MLHGDSSRSELAFDQDSDFCGWPAGGPTERFSDNLVEALEDMLTLHKKTQISVMLHRKHMMLAQAAGFSL